ncbi:hypothetical protein [Ferrovibrio sp.]
MIAITPKPWSLVEARTMVHIKGPNGEQVASLPKHKIEDARLIVAAVNAT